MSRLEEEISGLKEGMSGLEEEISGLKEGMSGLKNELIKLKDRVDELESKLERITISFYAVEEGIVRGKEMERKIRRYREDLISDPRGFNSLRWIRSRHY
jgi:predicted nuclease with TOPRIM domain